MHMYMLKRRGAKTDLRGRPVFRRRSLPDLLSPVVRVKLLFRTSSMIIWTMGLSAGSQQLTGEAMAPDSVISSCQIDEHGTSVLFCFKRILNVLRKQNDLMYGRFSVSKFNLFLWEQRVDYWFETIVDQSFEDLVRDADQRDGDGISMSPLQVFRA